MEKSFLCVLFFLLGSFKNIFGSEISPPSIVLPPLMKPKAKQILNMEQLSKIDLSLSIQPVQEETPENPLKRPLLPIPILSQNNQQSTTIHFQGKTLETQVKHPLLPVPILSQNNQQPTTVHSEQPNSLSTHQSVSFPRIAILVPFPSVLSSSVFLDKFENFCPPKEQEGLKESVTMREVDGREAVARHLEHHTALPSCVQVNNDHKNKSLGSSFLQKSSGIFLKQGHMCQSNEKRRCWSPEEDALLRRKVAQLGTSWKKIQPFFPGRSCVAIRNRWNRYLKKQMGFGGQDIFGNTVEYFFMRR